MGLPALEELGEESIEDVAAAGCHAVFDVVSV